MTETPRHAAPTATMIGRPRGNPTPGAGPAGRFLETTVLANLRAGVASVLAQQPRAEGIDEVDPDPRYENLYDRALAIMGDGAMVEHLAVAAAVDGQARVLQAGARWTAALSRAWHDEARRPANYGNAYVTSRLLKSLAIGYRVFGAGLSDDERATVEEFLATLASTLWAQWFSRPDVGGPTGIAPGRHSPHHSSVEWSAFGVGALGLLGVADDADRWVDATVEHFTRDLLPYALTVDGAPVEGIGILGYDTFWVSTMFSRIQFMDVLRNVTGQDLLPEHRHSMRTEMAQALFRRIPPLGAADGGEDRSAMTGRPLLPRSAGGVLCWLADRNDDPLLQALAMLDGRAGALDSSSYATPGRGIRGRGPMNSYAALWLRDDLEPVADIEPRQVVFASVGIAANPRGWRQGGFSAALDEGRVLVWLDGDVVYQDLVPRRECDVARSEAAGTPIFDQVPLELHGVRAGAGASAAGDVLEARNHDGRTVARVTVSRDGRSARIERRLACDHVWRTALRLSPQQEADRWRLEGDADAVEVVAQGCRLAPGTATDTRMLVGYGLLELTTDPDPIGCHDHLIQSDGGDADGWAVLALTIADRTKPRSTS